MAPPSATADSGALFSVHGSSENNLQPFFVMRKGPEGRSSTSKTRRKIGFSSSREDAGDSADEDDDTLKRLRSEAFDFVWSEIESSIKDVLRKINKNVFDELHNWVSESFKSIRSSGRPGYSQATRSYPILTDASLKQLYTALVFTKNMEFVDDLLTFEELSHHLRSYGSHVANLSSSDFSANNGIGGCLRSLLRQFLTVAPDVADLSILSLWYNEQRDDQPVIIIIDDMERCCGKILSDFILMLSEWIFKVPVILIMGVATTFDAARVILPSDALQMLRPFKFVLGSPSERMDAVVEAILVRPCSWFTLGHKVLLFLKNNFINQDGTLTAFIRALKIACMLHFSLEPLSFLLKDLATEGVTELLQACIENHVDAQENLLNNAFELPSCRRKTEHTVESLADGLTELKKSQKSWGAVLLCLHEAGKSHKIQLLDLLCEALDPDSPKSRSSNNNYNSKREPTFSPSSEGRMLGRCANPPNSSFNQVVCKMRGLHPASMHELLKDWEQYVEDVPEIHEKVKDLCFMIKSGEGSNLRPNISFSMRHRFQNPSDKMDAKETKALSEKASRLIEWMLRFMTPIECLPFHEICCFKDVDTLQSALLGDPRRRVQSDLMESSKLLPCSCCTGRSSMLMSSLHDTSIMYLLAQEHGDVINLHDWYQSFKEVSSRLATTKRKKAKSSPSPKKRKQTPASQSQCEAVTQARFCRAVMELQITGLFRMPSKRRPDHVQRVAFGL